MPVSPDDFLQAAKDLLSGNREIDYRNVASRAYYGAYHRGQQLLERESIPKPATKEKGSHVALTELLKNFPSGTEHDKEKIKEIGRDIDRLRSLRTYADYHTSKPFNRSKAVEAKQLADLIFSQFSDLHREQDAPPPP